MDDIFLSIGLIDKNFNILNRDRYQDFFNGVNRDSAKKMPIPIDSGSRMITMNINPNSFIMVIQIDGVDSEVDMPDKKWIDVAKRNFCKGSYAQSKTIRKDGGMIVVATFMNDKFERILDVTFNTKECDQILS